MNIRARIGKLEQGQRGKWEWTPDALTDAERMKRILAIIRWAGSEPGNEEAQEAARRLKALLPDDVWLRLWQEAQPSSNVYVYGPGCEADAQAQARAAGHDVAILLPEKSEA